MDQTLHSVRVDARRCVGCTNCIKRCPTEAIRVQNGRAVIISERCVDCGECMRVCPHYAMLPVTSSLNELKRFKYNIAIPSPALYAQFKQLDLEDLFRALVRLGFDCIYEEAKAAEIVSEATNRLIRRHTGPWPLISTHCPVIVRLIQVCYPELIENLLPFEAPSEIAARISKHEFCEKTDVSFSDVGAFYIMPCAAKMASITHPEAMNGPSLLDGAIAIRDVYGALAKRIKETGDSVPAGPRAGAFGIGWAASGGESMAAGTQHYLAADGIYNVMKCLDEIENRKFSDLVLFEGRACTCGCVGGTLTFENAFVAKNQLRRQANSQPRINMAEDEHVLRYIGDKFLLQQAPILPRPVLQLSEDMGTAMLKMDRIEKIVQELPSLDCGSCGSPSCRALAEDIVRGNAKELDCIFKLRDKVRLLAQEMVDLAAEEKRR